MNKKGQTNGLITGLVFGVATLVVAVIIAFVIVATLTGAGLFEGDRTSATTTNETGAWVNTSGYTLDNFDSDTTKGISVSIVYNATNATGRGNYNITIPSANYTLDTTTGIITNATDYTYRNVSISYSVTTGSTEELSTEKLSANFSEGVDEVSKKVPTVLLIAAIILILSILAILVGVWNKMNIGGGAEL